MKPTEHESPKLHQTQAVSGTGEKACGLASGLCSLPQLKQVCSQRLLEQIREACLLVNEWSLVLDQTAAVDAGIANDQLTRLQQMQEDLASCLRSLPQPDPHLWQELAEFETLVLNFRLSLEFRNAVA